MRLFKNRWSHAERKVDVKVEVARSRRPFVKHDYQPSRILLVIIFIYGNHGDQKICNIITDANIFKNLCLEKIYKLI